jgi:adenine-specific DNA-methyltransferase
MLKKIPCIAKEYGRDEELVYFNGDCLELLKVIPSNSIQLIITSPPYNLGKEYEDSLHLELYLGQQKKVIKECIRVLKNTGSICWQVGNYVCRGAITPLDSALYPIFESFKLKMRNRIIWTFGHGLHCQRRFSGRYETVNWFTKSDDYFFNLDKVRIPQKYPGKKHYKGPKAGQYSCNPLGKNPGDIWEIPNVKSNHIEKTIHPCQFPVELVERFVLSMTREDDWVFDPFAGVGSTLIAAIRHRRRAMGAEILDSYVKVGIRRIEEEMNGFLKTRPMGRPIYDPFQSNNKLTISPWNKK